MANELIIPFIYGNKASRDFDLPEGHTHKWTIFVKNASDLELKDYVSSVHFGLHESFVNPKRVVSSPPFEVSETGWGEFFITIKIVFKAKEIKPVSFIHALKLHFDNTNIEIQGITDVVISEFYDEIIISNFPENQQNTFSLNDEIESSAKVLCEGMENALSKVENYLS